MRRRGGGGLEGHPLLVIPAVDVRAGRCVRLLRGDYAAETVYSDDPVETALSFAAAGARRVHVVDLDAARGRPDERSRSAVRGIVERLAERAVAVELGGGLRSAEIVDEWLTAGATLAVLGSLAIRDPAAAESICRAHPGRVLLGLDVRDGAAQVEGWTEAAGDARAVLDGWRGWPAAGVVRTDVGRDGALAGPDVEGLRTCIAAYGGPVIAGGGISSLEDMGACGRAGAAGVIVGRALYEGKIDLAEALRAFPPVAAPA